MGKAQGEIDWGKETKGTREVHPAGTYKVECTGWEECEASTGTPQIRWFTEIKAPEEFKGKKLVDHTALTSQALWRLAGLVQAFGIDLSEAPKMVLGSKAFKGVLDSCVHRTAYWTITKDEQYNNNKVTEHLLDPKQDVKVPTVSVDKDEQAPF